MTLLESPTLATNKRLSWIRLTRQVVPPVGEFVRMVGKGSEELLVPMTPNYLFSILVCCFQSPRDYALEPNVPVGPVMVLAMESSCSSKFKMESLRISLKSSSTLAKADLRIRTMIDLKRVFSTKSAAN